MDKPVSIRIRVRPSELHRFRAICAELRDVPSVSSWGRRALLFVADQVERAQAADRAKRELPK